jgi:hypothetical protein
VPYIQILLALVFSALGPIIFFLENNCIPVNKLNIATYPKAMPINEHVVPMRISANINLPPAILISFILTLVNRNKIVNENDKEARGQNG